MGLYFEWLRKEGVFTEMIRFCSVCVGEKIIRLCNQETAEETCKVDKVTVRIPNCSFSWIG